MRLRLRTHFLPVILGCFVLSQVADANEPTKAKSGVGPSIRWDFSTEESSRLFAHGGVNRDQLGPRPPRYPNADPGNFAVQFEGRGARFVIADPGPHSPFDFANGDEITLEVRLKLNGSQPGENVYLIGKGRTGNRRYVADNQNWAIRLRKINNRHRVSFVFATSEKNDSQNSLAQYSQAHWHRWTTDEDLGDGMADSADGGWHTIALAYRYGDPESIRGWIDGRAVGGRWDLGGPTSEPPIVDDDEVWIGSSMGGNAIASFRGWIDAIVIHRERLDNEHLELTLSPSKTDTPAKQEVCPITSPPRAKVLVELDESAPNHDQWPAAWQEQLTNDYVTERFFFPRLPYRYDDYGVRESWNGAVALRASADVKFMAGHSRVLMRARGLSRLWVDGKIVARLAPIQSSSDGHDAVVPLPTPPLPGMRRLGYGLKESIEELFFDRDRTVRVVFETIVGGKNFRAEPGEMMIAIEAPGANQFRLLEAFGQSDWPVEVTDAAIDEEHQKHALMLENHDRRTRHRLASRHDKYWNDRHEQARAFAEASETASQPKSIDAYIEAKASAIKADDDVVSEGKVSEDESFHQEVLPLLREHCFRCHDESDEGGLRLSSRQSMLDGGDSGVPVIAPGNADSSLLIQRITSQDEFERMPPSKSLSDDQVSVIREWINQGGQWPTRQRPTSISSSALINDWSFVRRAYLDTVGVPPTEQEARAFVDDHRPQKRSLLIDRLLNDNRWADHWVSYFQDILAENPNLLRPTLNNTGPFRWFLYESLRDNKPLDRMVTELVMLRGSEREGGAAGFGMAAENDAPLASRSIVLASAFLGMNLQCARCHDSPYHETTQQDLFSLAAMMSRSKVSVPPTSTVAPGFFSAIGGRKSLINVTLKPGQPVDPTWPFESLTGPDFDPADYASDPNDSREVLAVSLTAPHNTRFAQVIVNRVWHRLIGAGIVEPVDDWEKARPSHPELLSWLGNELLRSGYDLKHVVRLIMNANLYQRPAIGNNRIASAESRLFEAPDVRRMTAEQVIDTMVVASGRPLDTEELSFDLEAKRPADTMVSLGVPRRAWMYTTLSNERDRPSLAFPRSTAVVEVMEAFGWTGSRQSAVNERESDANVLQPGSLANSVFTVWTSSASVDSQLADLAVNAGSPAALVDSIFLRFLTRYPTSSEASTFTPELAIGFEDRLVPKSEQEPVTIPPPLSYVSWSNHLAQEANLIKIELEKRAQRGDPADPRLRRQRRERFEDVVWSVLNSPEFVWIP